MAFATEATLVATGIATATFAAGAAVIADDPAYVACPHFMQYVDSSGIVFPHFEQNKFAPNSVLRLCSWQTAGSPSYVAAFGTVNAPFPAPT